MRGVLVSDIFGLTDELIELRNLITEDVVILDPYEGKKNLFNDENDAYKYFSEHCTLGEYAEIVRHEITKNDEAEYLIGFSVGASAIWCCSDKLSQKNVSSAYLFYGSQIRKHVEITPAIPINIVMPRYEEHFSILELKESLASFGNIEIQSSNGLHGFMNKRSKNYNQTEYDNYVCKLRQYVT